MRSSNDRGDDIGGSCKVNTKSSDRRRAATWRQFASEGQCGTLPPATTQLPLSIPSMAVPDSTKHTYRSYM